MSEDLLTIGEMLEAMSDADTARRLGKQVQPLRGVRGVPMGEVARIAAASWEEFRPSLPKDAGALSRLYSTAWEDGLVAIGLVGACVPDAPRAAFELGMALIERCDDVATADALGWLVLGPAALASGRDLADAMSPIRGLPDGTARRAAVSAGLAATPTPIEGPSAAPVRARMQQARVRWVETCQSPTIARILDASLRDEAPPVRKAVRRLLRVWGQDDPAAVEAWAAGVKGGLPSMLRAEVDRARKKAKRAARELGA